MKKKIIALMLAAVMCLGVMPLSASAAGGTYTVTFEPNPKTLACPYEFRLGYTPAAITVTNGDKWSLPPSSQQGPGYETSWYTADLVRINNGDTVSLTSDITLYACSDEAVAYEKSKTGGTQVTVAPIDKTLSKWAEQEVETAVALGLVPDNLKNNFTTAVTREEFCALMVKLIETRTKTDIATYAASKGKTISAPFTDTSAQEVKAAYTLGIVNGVSADKFNPSGSITRQEAAVMLTRTAKLLDINSKGTSYKFSDSGDIASWAADSVTFVAGLTTSADRVVMGGTGTGKFEPLGSYTREQAIATTLRLFECA